MRWMKADWVINHEVTKRIESLYPSVQTWSGHYWSGMVRTETVHLIDYNCFGGLLKLKALRRGYAQVGHYTLEKCCEKSLGTKLCVCLKKRKDSDRVTITEHIIGECPACIYKEL